MYISVVPQGRDSNEERKSLIFCHQYEFSTICNSWYISMLRYPRRAVVFAAPNNKSIRNAESEEIVVTVTTSLGTSWALKGFGVPTNQLN